MGYVSKIIKILYSKSFWWILILTFLLYGFSYRFPISFYLVPFAFFISYYLLNHKKRFTLSLDIIILFFLMTVFAIILFFGGFLSFDFNIRIKTATYILLFLFPLFFIFYNEVKTNPLEITKRNLLFAYFIIGILLMTLYFKGFIASNRYQHVGNALGATTILFFTLKNKKMRWTLFLIWVFSLLLVGSRQALVGLLFSGLIYVLVSNYKVFLTFILSCILIVWNKDYIIGLIEELSIKYNAVTVRRIIHAINSGGGKSVETRLKVYSNLVEEVGFFPNFTFSQTDDSLLPHNFFLEYFIVCGILIGSIFLLYIFSLIIRSILENRNSVLVYFSLFYFVSFNVSTGISAAKYFIYYSFLLIVLLDNSRVKKKLLKKENEENTFS